MTPDYSGHPKSHLKAVEGAVSGSGRCSEDAEQEESEGLELHPCCLFSEALMDYDHTHHSLFHLEITRSKELKEGQNRSIGKQIRIFFSERPCLPLQLHS